MRILVPAVVLVLLFAGGLAIGALFFDRTEAGPAEVGLEDGGNVPGSVQSTDLAGVPERDQTEVPGVGDAPGRPGEEASQGGQQASGPSDAQQAVSAPDRAAEPSPPSAPGFLEGGFGPAAAPSPVAGMQRTLGPTISGDTLEAEYSGGDAGDLDLLFLTVVKTGSPTAARQQADEFIHAFPISPVSFTWGGRQIRQAMTDEGRPNQFPPLICMVWTDGSYAVRVVTAPLAPDQVVAARDSTLDFVGALPY